MGMNVNDWWEQQRSEQNLSLPWEWHLALSHRAETSPIHLFPRRGFFAPFRRCNLHYYLPGRSRDCGVLLLPLSAFPANGEDGKLEEDLSSVTVL